MDIHRLLYTLAATSLILISSGCSQGVNWRKFAFDADDIAADARGELVFVYLRHWAVPACTRFEEDVLKNPAVLEQTRAMYCVVMNYSADREQAEGWGIQEPPGVVFMTADGEVLGVLNGFKTVQELLDAIGAARGQLASRTGQGNSTQPRP